MRPRTLLIAAAALGAAFVPLLASAHSIPYFGPIIESSWDLCPLGWAAVINVVNNIITIALTIIMLFIAPIMIAYAGFMLVVNPFNPGAKEKAKKLLLNIVIGLVVALSAWLIVDAIMAVLYKPDAVGANWYALVTSGGLPVCILQAGSLYSLNQGGGQTVGGDIGITGVDANGNTYTTCHAPLVCTSNGTCLPAPSDCGSNKCKDGTVCGSDGSTCVYPKGVTCGSTTCQPNYICSDATSGTCLPPQSCVIPPAGGGGSCTAIPDSGLVAIQGSYKLIPDAAARFMSMKAAAAKDGINLIVSSAYRSPDDQMLAWTNNGCRLVNGKAVCDTRTAAVPCALGGNGSNHTRGTAVDIKLNTGVYAWLRANAANFGFYNYLSNDLPHWSDTGR